MFGCGLLFRFRGTVRVRVRFSIRVRNTDRYRDRVRV